MEKYSAIDLFCGAGGWSEGLEQSGFDIILAIDFWDKAIETHKLNHPKTEHRVMNIMDLTTLPKCDVLVGSPPCIHFSGASRYKKDLTKGRILVDKFITLAQRTDCKYWIGENVWGIEPIIMEWQKKDPSIKYMKVLCSNYGAKNRRPRIFFGNFPVPSEKIIANPSPTVKGGHRECANSREGKTWLKYCGIVPYKQTNQYLADLQCFPTNYKWFGNKKDVRLQIGNAVCPATAKQFGKQIRKML
jgi:site-specific DNA-cytosine methylase